MKPESVLEQAKAAGLTLVRTLRGTIQISGPAFTVKTWAPRIRAYKRLLIELLPLPKIETAAQIIEVPLRPCIWCARFNYKSGYCQRYTAKLPEPRRECRCVHYQPRKH